MGTRNLTMVVSNGKTKIAQYGQWDGYPSGQGMTILNFLKSTDLKAFEEKLKTVRFADATDEKEKRDFLKKIGCADGWMNEAESKKYHDKYPYDNRDHGGEILQLIMDAKEKEIVLNDSTDFAEDSLFCEWAYVVDFDKNTFEIYRGFNTTQPLNKEDRFFSLQKEDQQYKPVRMLTSFNISELPENLEAVEQMEEEEAD